MKILIKCLLALLGTSCALILIAASLLHGWVVPHMDDVRPRLEAYLSERAGHSVRIGNITAESSGLLPSFDLLNVQMVDALQTPLLSLGRVQVDISPLSLLTLEIDRLTIDAPTVSIVRDAAGHISVAGIQIGSQGGSGGALDWVFSQKEIVIREGTLNWTDAQSHVFGRAEAIPSATFSRVAITLKNASRSHHLHVEASPPEAWGQSMSVTGKFVQPVFEARPGRLNTWTGGIDAHIKHIPALAHHIKLHVDWPLREVSLEGEQVMLASLAQLARRAGYTLPQDPALRAVLTSVAPHVKLQAQHVDNDQLRLRLAATLENADFAGEVDASWEKEGGKIDAAVRMAHLDLAALHRYVPEEAPPAIHQVLQSTLQKGVVSDVRVALAGTLTHLTELRATGKVRDAQLTMPSAMTAQAPWATMTKTQFAFDLQDAQLEISHLSTELANLTGKGSMRIADIHHPVLQARLDVTGRLTDALAVVRREPFKTMTKDAFAASEATGDMASHVEITAPLFTPSQATMVGHIQLLGNDVVFNAATPAVSAMKGKIQFTHKSVQIDYLHGKVLGGDVHLSGHERKLVGHGVVSAQGLTAWPGLALPEQLASRMHGKTSYTFSREPHTGWLFESTLVGLALDLPAPLAKTATKTLPLRIQQTADQDQLTMALGDVLVGKWIRTPSLSRPAGSAVRGSLMLGIGSQLNDLAIPEQGVRAYAKLEQFDADLWRQVLGLDEPKSAMSGGITSAAASYMPTQIAAHVDTLQVARRRFTQVVLGVSQAGSTWRANVHANDFDGYGEYRPSSADQAGQLYLRLARFAVPDANSQSHIEQLLQAAPERIPAVDVIVDDFEVMGKKVGRIEVLAVNQRSPGNLRRGSAQEWRLQKLQITHPDATFKATGVWLPPSHADSGRADQRRVDVQFNLEVLDSGALLTRLGLPGTMKDGKGSLQGRVAWVGSPWTLHLPTLVGQIKMDMSKGQFLKIEPGRAGRFFNVLSLQALPRLLTLDFRDVFSEGFAFDSLSGDAQIQDGVMRSNNLQMKSVLALVSMDGSVDLAKETQQLHVLVLPDINAGGASLIATLINPVVGAATYLAQLVLRRPVVAAATKEYNIQGSWQAPTIVPIQQRRLPSGSVTP